MARHLLSTNIVDVLTLDGTYLRVLIGARAPVLVRITHSRPAVLTVTLEGNVGDRALALTLVLRMLGAEPPCYSTFLGGRASMGSSFSRCVSSRRARLCVIC